MLSLGSLEAEEGGLFKPLSCGSLLKQLYKTICHPSFVGVICVLWSLKCMHFGGLSLRKIQNHKIKRIFRMRKITKNCKI